MYGLKWLSPRIPNVLVAVVVTTLLSWAIGFEHKTVVDISSIIGAGSLNIEVVTIQRVGDGELHMEGWRLEDSAGHRFIFPDIVLYKGGTVRVFSRAGTNTVNELFWGLSEPVWKSGKTISLFDNYGILRATLAVP